jgi:hypothetical protein
MADGSQLAKALEALRDPKNEPVRWLLEGALREHVEKHPNSPNFLLDFLATQPRRSGLTAWNANIHQFRDLVVNPDVAPVKAFKDLRSGGEDAGEKLTSLMAEVMAVIHLQKLGYSRFEVLMPLQEPTPDFNAYVEGKEARIEVKNLREPQDIVRTVASKHWKKRAMAKPIKYNFGAILHHDHRGSLSRAAMRELCTIIDQLPDRQTPFETTIDGGAKIRVARINDTGSQLSPVAREGLKHLISGKGQIIIASAIRQEHFSISVSEIQSLMLKALRTVTGATDKFFGASYRADIVNVAALRWEPPDLLSSDEMLAYTGEKIQSLFADFNMELRTVLFCDPEIPWELIRQYR